VNELPAPEQPSPRTPLSREEFGRLFASCWHALWVIAAAILSDREQASDIVQESGATAFAKREEFTPGTSFEHWMAQIVRFTALNELRKRRIRREQHSEFAADIPDEPGHSGPAGVGRFGQLMEATEAFDDQTKRALRQLEEIPRACLLLRTVLDMPYSEISRTLGIPEATAMTNVHRSRQRMRAALMATTPGVQS
jgi:RNA polymerase sigma-70 factor (ECF subfamily)